MRTIELHGKVYTISFEAMPNALQEKLGKLEQQKYLKLLEAVQKNPKSAYQDIKDFSVLHSDLPEVLNLLTFSHIQNNRLAQAEELIQQTYVKYPEYFFAKINYADLCIRKKNIQEILQIFPSFHLKELFPEKTTYHISEFRGFLLVMAYYYKEKKEKEKAIFYFNKAKELQPHHPSVLYLEKKLFTPSFFQRFFRMKEKIS